MDDRPDLIDDTLIVLADILGMSDRVLARANHRDARFQSIRQLAAQLQNAILDHWARVAASDHDDERQLDFETLWPTAGPGNDID